MSRKVLKILLIVLGFIPFIWLILFTFNETYSYFDLLNFPIDVVINILTYPWVLLGLIPICIGVLLRTDKVNKHISKKEIKKKKIFWKVMLVLGTIPFIIPLVLSIICLFFGFTFFFDTIYGFEGMFSFLVIWSFIFWPTYIVGLVLIILSIIKIKKNKLQV